LTDVPSLNYIILFIIIQKMYIFIIVFNYITPELEVYMV
jgi:hypothetical protein